MIKVHTAVGNAEDRFIEAVAIMIRVSSEETIRAAHKAHCAVVEAAVVEAVAQEREACARIADCEAGCQLTDANTRFSPHQTVTEFKGARDAAKAIAIAIRARDSETK